MGAMKPTLEFMSYLSRAKGLSLGLATSWHYLITRGCAPVRFRTRQVPHYIVDLSKAKAPHARQGHKKDAVVQLGCLFKRRVIWFRSIKYYWMLFKGETIPHKIIHRT